MTDRETPPPADRPKVTFVRRKKFVPEAFGRNLKLETPAVRHQGRILAMQSIFEMDMAGHDLDDIIDRIRGDEYELSEAAKAEPDDDEADVDDIPEPVAAMAISLMQGVHDNQREIDPVIEEAAPQFPIGQLASVDRAVLRMAIYELTWEPDVPYKAVINEAVEIAKRFGGPNSGKFVNGVLGTVSKRLPPERTASCKR